MDLIDIIRGKFGKYPIIKRVLSPFNVMICEYRKKKRYKNFLIYRDDSFKDIIEIFKREHIDYWVEFGTLLGIYRDNSFIPGDDDFDFGAFVEDAERIKQVFTKFGYTIIKDYEAIDDPTIKEMTFKNNSNGITFDVFFFNKKEECYSCYIFALSDIDIISQKKYYKVKQYDFLKFDLIAFSFPISYTNFLPA